METTRFQVYKVSVKANKIILAFLVAMSVFSLWGTLTILISENPKFLDLSISSYLVFLMQSVLGIFLTWKNFKNEKYFVSWDDNEIQYQLPKDKEPVLIRIEDIQAVEKTDRDFMLTLKNNETKNFSFNYFYFPTRQTIFDFFESVKIRVEKGKLTIY